MTWDQRDDSELVHQVVHARAGADVTHVLVLSISSRVVEESEGMELRL